MKALLAALPALRRVNSWRPGWDAQIFLRIENPKPSYVAPWEELPAWQQEVDADIFESIEKEARTEVPGA